MLRNKQAVRLQMLPRPTILSLVALSRVKFLAGFLLFRRWGLSGRLGPDAPPWAGSMRSPREAGWCCTPLGSPQHARSVRGRRGSRQGRAAHTSGPRTRIRASHSAPGTSPGCACLSSGWLVMNSSKFNDLKGPPLSVTMVTAGSSSPVSGSTGQVSPNGTLPSLVWCWSALLSLRFGVCGDAGDERVELAGQCAVLFA